MKRERERERASGLYDARALVSENSLQVRSIQKKFTGQLKGDAIKC